MPMAGISTILLNRLLHQNQYLRDPMLMHFRMRIFPDRDRLQGLDRYLIGGKAPGLDERVMEPLISVLRPMRGKILPSKLDSPYEDT
jgi:hypothetical protein